VGAGEVKDRSKFVDIFSELAGSIFNGDRSQAQQFGDCFDVAASNFYAE
jgi:hypothetical protein